MSTEAGPVVERIECPDGTVLTLHADGDRWSWTCSAHPTAGASGNQQYVTWDADYHAGFHGSTHW